MMPATFMPIRVLTTAMLCMCTLAACSGDDGGARTETETHFLRACDDGCGEGLACICGVCTAACDGDSACARFAGGEASCEPTPAACATRADACELACSGDADCATLGAGFECSAGACRTAVSSAGSGGASGGGGSGGSGGAGGGGGSDAGNGGFGGSAGAGSGGAGGDAGAAGQVSSGGQGGGGGASGGGGSGGSGQACDTLFAPCCSRPQDDGPSYCDGGLACDHDNRCVDCNCVLGGFTPVCGVDGVTHDAHCGRVCVPIAIACDGACPCECTAESATGCAQTEPGGGVPCCNGLTCCEGVPYDIAGQCAEECLLESDRALKTDVQAIDPQAVLESVARLPIHAWRYRARPEAVHVGPMAQDFAAELQLGADDRVIAAVDASGVALAAIQALYERVERLSAHNQALVDRVAELEARPACASEPTDGSP